MDDDTTQAEDANGGRVQTPSRGKHDIHWIDLNADWRIAYDKWQWILQKRSGQAGAENWKGLYFCGTKAGLLTCVIREVGRKLTAEAAKALQELPESHAYWYALQHEQSEADSPAEL